MPLSDSQSKVVASSPTTPNSESSDRSTSPRGDNSSQSSLDKVAAKPPSAAILCPSDERSDFSLSLTPSIHSREDEPAQGYDDCSDRPSREYGVCRLFRHGDPFVMPEETLLGDAGELEVAPDPEFIRAWRARHGHE
ncbi:hypothetical protein BKA80DRAFT_273799 [Phyllosticta citrichinensis]